MLGQVQNFSRKRFGSNSSESVFYVHTLSLPLFALLSDELWAHASKWSSSPQLADAVTAVQWASYLPLAVVGQLPFTWAIVVVNIVSQYVGGVVLGGHGWPSSSLSSSL